MGEQAAKISKNTYTKGELIGYLTGMFGQNLIYQVVAAGLVSYYLGKVICIPAGAVSAIIFVARIWDAINDLMMGTIVDKTHSKWGKCRPYLIIFPAIIGLMTVLCFINGDYPAAKAAAEAAKGEGAISAQMVFIVAWAAASYIIWGMLFTICDIPLWGITSLMTEDQDDRAKIIGLARIAAGVGGIGTVISFIPSAITGFFPNAENPERTAWMATVIAVVVVATIFFEFAGVATKERVAGEAKEKKSIKDNFATMWNCKPFRQILISGVLRSPLQLLMLLAVDLLMFCYLDNDTKNISNDMLIFKVALIGLMVFIPQFTAMAITPNLVKRFENKKIYNFYSIAGAVPYLLVFVVYLIFKDNLHSWPAVICTAILIGGASASMGGINVMQSVMIADCVDYEEYHNGNRPDGIFFSGQSFLTKLSGGIAAAIQGVVYEIVHFSGEEVDAIKTQLSTGTQHFYQMDGGSYAKAMFFLISIPIAIGMIASAIPMFKYAMTDKQHTEILDALVEKRKGEAE